MENDFLKIEQEIKHLFLPYETHLKITQIGRFIDNEPMMVEEDSDGFQYTLNFDL